jgi:hypothetical protein
LKGIEMKVWIGYEASFDGADVYRHLKKVFDCEVKAFLWVEEKQDTDYEWREFEVKEVE